MRLVATNGASLDCGRLVNFVWGDHQRRGIHRMRPNFIIQLLELFGVGFVNCWLYYELETFNKVTVAQMQQAEYINVISAVV